MRTPFFNRFPYTNLNDINLDWIIKKVKILQTRVDNLDPEDFSERLEAVEALAEQASTDAAQASTDAAQASTDAATAVETAEATAETVSGLPADTLPLIDGTATAGTAGTLARSDHVHPVDMFLYNTLFSSLPYDDSNAAGITSDMICVGYYTNNPRVVEGVWTITTGNGSIHIDGKMEASGNTRFHFYFTKGVTING